MNQLADAPSTGDTPSKDITSRLEAALYPEGNEEQTPDLKPVDEGVLDGDLIIADSDDDLPDDDDPELDDDDQVVLDDIADDDEELTLAGYLGVEDDRIQVDEETGEVSFLARIDDEDKVIPLAELAKSFQMQGHVNNSSIALANERKEFEDVKTLAIGELKQQIDGVTALSNMMETELVSDYKGINWDQLRVDDPANWTALRQEYAEKAQRIQQVQGLVQEQAEHVQGENRKNLEVAMGKYFKSELEAMIRENPTWSDESVRTADMGGIKTFLKSTYGFKDEDMNTVNDHRLVNLIKDAKAYREGNKTAEKKRVKKLPKFQKPGASRANTAASAKARNMKAKRAAVKKGGGKTSDVANLLIDRM